LGWLCLRINNVQDVRLTFIEICDWNIIRMGDHGSGRIKRCVVPKSVIVIVVSKGPEQTNDAATHFSDEEYADGAGMLVRNRCDSNCACMLYSECVAPPLIVRSSTGDSPMGPS
jgi:hypothetical protein